MGDRQLGSVTMGPSYTNILETWLFGQCRIRLCDTAIPDPAAPDKAGAIVREL